MWNRSDYMLQGDAVSLLSGRFFWSYGSRDMVLDLGMIYHNCSIKEAKCVQESQMRSPSHTIRDEKMLVGEAWAAVTHLCMNTVWRSVCPDLVHDFKESVVMKI